MPVAAATDRAQFPPSRCKTGAPIFVSKSRFQIRMNLKSFHIELHNTKTELFPLQIFSLRNLANQPIVNEVQRR